GRETSRTLGNGLTTTRSYATNENLVASIANSAVGTYSYGYDANHNRTSETITGTLSGYGWSTGTGGYDDEDRLVNWDRSDSNLSHDWTLSEVGDWDSVSVNGTPESRIRDLSSVADQSFATAPGIARHLRIKRWTAT